MRRVLLTSLLLTLLWPAPGPAQRNGASDSQPAWKLQYFYDQEGKDLHITDFAFPSAKRGIAVGAIVDREGRKPLPTALVTSDAGEHWSLVPLKEFPRSLFFLDESNGWLLTGESLWFTAESGHSWARVGAQVKPNRKLAGAPRTGLILRVWFLDRQHGYAVGMQKSVFETHDGGRTWKYLDEAAKPAGDPALSVYSHIAFADSRSGTIFGAFMTPRAARDNGGVSDEPRSDAASEDDLPDWMRPERALTRRQQPHIGIEMDTRDGGAVWKFSTAPLLGSVISLRLAGAGGLAVFNYADSFEWPAEVYRLNLTSGKSDSVYKQKDRLVTDAAIFPDGRAFLAAVEPPGRLRSAPIPGKVKMLSSTNLKDWTEAPVDYRAVAQTVLLSGSDAEHVWAATDTGMILHLASR